MGDQVADSTDELREFIKGLVELDQVVVHSAVGVLLHHLDANNLTEIGEISDVELA